jgi:hypothetical protein
MSTEVLGFWASIVCLGFIAERSSADGRGFSHGSSEASRWKLASRQTRIRLPRRIGQPKRCSQARVQITISEGFS